MSHLKQIVFLVKPDWLLVQLLSVLKCKSFWHFTRFIEHSPNLDKLYVQIHWTFYESGHSKTLPGWLTFQDGGSIFYQIEVGPIQNPNCCNRFGSKPLAAWSVRRLELPKGNIYILGAGLYWCYSQPATSLKDLVWDALPSSLCRVFFDSGSSQGPPTYTTHNADAAYT